MGLEDLKEQVKMDLPTENGRGKVEDEVVVALAEVMDTYAYIQSPGIWENEFQPATEPGEGTRVWRFSLVLKTERLHDSGCTLIGFDIGISCIGISPFR